MLGASQTYREPRKGMDANLLNVLWESELRSILAATGADI